MVASEVMAATATPSPAATEIAVVEGSAVAVEVALTITL
jgi:hypothetical protein